MQIGFVVPMMKEAMGVIKRFDARAETTLHGRRLRLGKLARHDCAVIISGRGKIASASATQTLIDTHKPELLFHFGSAGAIASGLKIGDFVIADEVIEHDFKSHFGTDIGRVPTSSPTIALTAKLEAQAIDRSRRYVRGIVLSGNEDIVTTARRDELLKLHSGQAVDWESAGFAQVAAAAAIDHAVVRVISDYAYEHTASEFMANIHAISDDLGGFLADFIELL